MKLLESDLSKNLSINLDHTINSGQVFLWKKINTKWYGVDGDKILVLQNNQKFDKNIKHEYDFLRLGDNFAQEARSIFYDKKKTQGIYGTVTAEEIDELNDEGIETTTIPWYDNTEN